MRDDSNPFAVVVLTALSAILHRHITDDELKDIKHDLYDEMMRRNMDKTTRQGLYDFLAYYVSFQNQENFYIFETEVQNNPARALAGQIE